MSGIRLPLTSTDAERIMAPRLGRQYLGYAMEDEVRDVLKKRATGTVGESLLLNLDEEDGTGPGGGAGTHWVGAILLHGADGKPRVRYFDSFGGGPGRKTEPVLAMWGRKRGEPYPVDHGAGSTFQHPKSNTCGLFVCAVLLLLARGCSPRDVLEGYLQNGEVERNEWMINQTFRGLR